MTSFFGCIAPLCLGFVFDLPTGRVKLGVFDMLAARASAAVVGRGHFVLVCVMLMKFSKRVYVGKYKFKFFALKLLLGKKSVQ